MENARAAGPAGCRRVHLRAGKGEVRRRLLRHSVSRSSPHRATRYATAGSGCGAQDDPLPRRRPEDGDIRFAVAVELAGDRHVAWQPPGEGAPIGEGIAERRVTDEPLPGRWAEHREIRDGITIKVGGD